VIGSKYSISHPTLLKYIKVYQFIKEWNMAEVYLLGILIAMIKLEQITDMVVDYGLWFNFLYVTLFYIALTWFNPYSYVHYEEQKVKDPKSIFKSVIYLLIAIQFILPALILPMMPTYEFDVDYMNTIFGGILSVYRQGDYFIALVIFTSSMVIPIVKIFGLFIMILMAKYNIFSSYKKNMTKYYRLTHFIGKYTMIDVYVVVLMSTFIQYDKLVRVGIGDAIVPFMLVVFFTMLASKSFDTRLLWKER